MKASEFDTKCDPRGPVGRRPRVEGADAVLLLGRAGWRTTAKLDAPSDVTPIFLPSRAPELNSVENVWQHLRASGLFNSVFESYDAIIEAAWEA